MIFSSKISPYGGYLSIDEGSDFYLECIGDESEWILPARLTTNLTRVSNNYKSILIIRSMNSNLQGPYICQTSQTFSTIILQLTQRKSEMVKQIRFMNINTNQTVQFGSNVQLNCFAQYYSEKAMDSPYLPKILWFFERKQLFNDNQKYILGQDSLVIRNFTAIDQGVYYCRAFITLKTQILTKIYPILVQLYNSSAYSINSSHSFIPNKQCNYSESPLIKNDTITYCNIHGYLSNISCSMMNNTYPCSSNTISNQTIEILPNVAHLNVESGRIYTFVCRTNRTDLIPEWIYENQNSLSDKQITSYTLTKSNEIYLRLAPAFPGTYICRARPRDNDQITIQTSITLATPMLMETNGISFQSSTLSEYHLKVNATLFLACRPEYFDFQNQNLSIIPLANLIRLNDNKHFSFSNTIDGLLINRVQKNDSGMYLCLGQIPFNDRIEISYNPIMIFVSD